MGLTSVSNLLKLTPPMVVHIKNLVIIIKLGNNELALKAYLNAVKYNPSLQATAVF